MDDEVNLTSEEDEQQEILTDLNEENVEVEETSFDETTKNLKETFTKFTHETASLKKYLALRKRCEQVQQTNEKLVNRIQNVKKIIKRYKKERVFLVNKLDEFGDKFEDVDVPASWEEDHVYRRLYPAVVAEAVESQRTSEISTSIQDKLATLHAITSTLPPEGSGSHSKKVKVEKDPLAPKKPANAFLLFCQKHRGSVQEEYSKEHGKDIANYELTKRLAQQWNTLTKEDKSIFFEMYEKEKERYDRDMKKYLGKDDSEQSASNPVSHATTGTTGDTLSQTMSAQDAQVYKHLLAIKQEMKLDKF